MREPENERKRSGERERERTFSVMSRKKGKHKLSCEKFSQNVRLKRCNKCKFGNKTKCATNLLLREK